MYSMENSLRISLFSEPQNPWSGADKSLNGLRKAIVLGEQTGHVAKVCLFHFQMQFMNFAMFQLDISQFLFIFRIEMPKMTIPHKDLVSIRSSMNNSTN